MKFLKSNRGFTLIELLVVVAIISLLTSIVLASLQEARDKAKDSVVVSQLSNMRLSAEQAYSENSYGLSSGANDCAGLSSYISDFSNASKWPTIDGTSQAPTCFSNASAGSAITSFSLWHKTTSGGWCVDSEGRSVSMATAPNSANCSGGGGDTIPQAFSSFNNQVNSFISDIQSYKDSNSGEYPDPITGYSGSSPIPDSYVYGDWCMYESESVCAQWAIYVMPDNGVFDDTYDSLMSSLGWTRDLDGYYKIY